MRGNILINSFMYSYVFLIIRNFRMPLLCFQNTVCAITCIAVVSTVDYMIAAGTSTGVVSVFLVPKASPENIPEVFKNNSKKQVHIISHL